MAFTYYSPISINAAQVPSTQTDFPVLVSVTDNRFKISGSGGHVLNSSGFDIRPYSDSGLSSAITGYELERYNSSTGEVIMWVKVASLSSSTTPIYLAYGDAALNTDGSSASTTWSNSFGDVWHAKDGTTLSLIEAIGGGTLTNNGGVTAAAGKINGCGGFAAASSQYITGISYQQNAITYSIWVNATSFPAAYNYAISKVNAGGTQFNLIGVKSTGKMRWAVSATTQLDADGTGIATLSLGTWYYLVLTYDSTNGLNGYVNAVLDKNVAANGVCSTITQGVGFGIILTFNIQFWNGLLDEAHLASVARSQDWITTEYNNQVDPGTFETLGAEVSLAPFRGLYTK